MIIVYYLTVFVLFIGLYLGVIWLFFLVKQDIKSEKIIRKYPAVTVAIPAHNEEKTIEKTLYSLLSQDYPKDKLKIIVINDGSTDSTSKILKKFKQKNIKIITKKKNGGKARGLNDALKFVDTPYFSCLDADSVLEKDALKNNIKYFSRKVGAVISIIKVQNAHGVLGISQMVEYIINALYRRIFALNDFLTVTPGVLSVYRTDIVKKIKGFDPKTITEDFEIALRVIKEGYKIEMSPESITYTSVPLKFGAFWRQRIRWYRGFIETYWKHRDMIFSSKYGLLGTFFVPFGIIGPFLLFLSISLIIYKSAVELYRFIFKLLFAFKTIQWFHFSGLKETIYETNFFIQVPVVVSLLIVLYFLIKAIFFSNEKINIETVSGTIIYLFVYPYITLLQWIHAIFLHFSKSEKKW